MTEWNILFVILGTLLATGCYIQGWYRGRREGVKMCHPNAHHIYIKKGNYMVTYLPKEVKNGEFYCSREGVTNASD